MTPAQRRFIAAISLVFVHVNDKTLSGGLNTDPKFQRNCFPPGEMEGGRDNTSVAESQHLHHLRVAAEHLKLAEEHDLAHKLMEKAADIERDAHAAKLRLGAEMHADSEHHGADRPDLVAKLKEENERLRAELRELKQNADKRK